MDVAISHNDLSVAVWSNSSDIGHVYHKNFPKSAGTSYRRVVVMHVHCQL